MKEFGGFDGVKGGSERQSLMDPEPLAGVAMPLDIEPVAADPVDMAEDESRSHTLRSAFRLKDWLARPWPQNAERGHGPVRPLGNLLSRRSGDQP
jgi:hypothetical protein